MKKILILLCIIAVISTFAGCSGKESDTSGSVSSGEAQNIVDSEEKQTVSKVESMIDFESTDKESTYADYSETNEKFDKDGNVTLSNIYDPSGELIGYRKYGYDSESNVTDMKTYTTDDELKSTLHYDYDENKITISVLDKDNKLVLKLISESSEEAETIGYYDSDDSLMFTQKFTSDVTDVKGYDPEGNELDDDEYKKLLEDTQNILNSYMF
ncbi:MAG: hypothetical protein PUC88_06785 [Clostridia bacterium]|nr:hypothetical protein [Clostridia bacterium]